MKIHFSQLQKQYPVFRYVSFNSELLSGDFILTFNFEIGEHKFSPKITIKNVDQDQLDKLGKENVDNFIFHLGLAEIPSYWKLTCSPTIQVEAGHLDAMQQGFWRKLIEKGMGEFYFVNDIVPFAPQIETLYTKDRIKVLEELPPIRESDRVLLPVGGGKDSIVSMELMLKSRKKPIFFTIGKDQATEDIIEIFNKKNGETKRIEIERELDPRMLQLNARGYLNGHTPFSSIVAFNSLFAATLFRIPYIVLSNERSANEETGVYHGVNINHQYSKSFEFESDFHSYCDQTFKGAAVYFSLLRPLYEIQIMKLFSKHHQYFHAFRSCNIGKKTNSWCGSCAKCLFVYLLLSAFLPSDEVENVFGKNMLADPELISVLKQLTGDAVMKAFECVGTRAETMAALYLVWKKMGKDADSLPLIAEYHEYMVKHELQLEQQAKDIMKSYDENNLIPREFVKVVSDAAI